MIHSCTKSGQNAFKLAKTTTFSPICSQRYVQTSSNTIEGIKIVHGSLSDRWLVIDKPAGLSVQCNQPERDSVQKRLGSVLGDVSSVYLVHRLDKYTRGLLVIATNSETCGILARSLMAKKWMKKYRVLTDTPSCFYPSTAHGFCSHQNGPFSQGSIRLPYSSEVQPHGFITSHISRRIHNSRDTSTFAAEYDAVQQEHSSSFSSACSSLHCQCNIRQNERINGRLPMNPILGDSLCYETVPQSEPLGPRQPQKYRGKEAKTEFWLQRHNPTKQVALFEAMLHSGRTHQIRIHFADAAFPVVNDIYYNLTYMRRLLADHPEFSVEKFNAFLRSHGKGERISHYPDDLNLPPFFPVMYQKIEDGVTYSEGELAFRLKAQCGLGLQASYLEFPDPHSPKDRVMLSLDIPQEWDTALV